MRKLLCGLQAQSWLFLRVHQKEKRKTLQEIMELGFLPTPAPPSVI